MKALLALLLFFPLHFTSSTQDLWLLSLLLPCSGKLHSCEVNSDTSSLSVVCVPRRVRSGFIYIHLCELVFDFCLMAVSSSHLPQIDL